MSATVVRDQAGQSRTFRFVERERFPGLTMIHHVEADGTLWASRGRAVLRRPLGRSWEPAGCFPFVASRDLWNWSRPTARAARADKCNVFVNSLGTVIGIRSGTVHVITDGRLRNIGQLQGDCVLHGGMAEDADGAVYFGEYFRNAERGPVRIWRVSAATTCDVAYEFPAGCIRHVHGVYQDPFDDAALWVTTGDLADECHLWRTRDGFRTLERFGDDGGQMWRAVKPFFTPEHVCWLTDSHLEQNYACRMSRRHGRLERGMTVPCSSWYGATTIDGLHVAFTTVEPGPGIQEDVSRVLVSQDAFEWATVQTYKKDAWRPMQVFKYGVIACPSGPMHSSAVFLSGEGLSGFDGCSVCADLTAEDVR